MAGFHKNIYNSALSGLRYHQGSRSHNILIYDNKQMLFLKYAALPF